MISAFGIEHVQKSYVPGAGYVKAKDLTPGMKGIIRTRLKPQNKGSDKSSSDHPIPGRRVRGQSSKGRQMHDEMEIRSLNRRIVTDVLPEPPAKNLKPTGVVHLGHSKMNGRGGGILRINAKASPELQATTYRHEMAHLKPRRNPVRFAERTADPRRSGREEGRADFIGNQGKRTPGAYPGGKEFQRGYNEVQNKMHQRRKPRKFAVDSKGTAVQKSAFGIAHGDR